MPAMDAGKAPFRVSDGRVPDQRAIGEQPDPIAVGPAASPAPSAMRRRPFRLGQQSQTRRTLGDHPLDPAGEQHLTCQQSPYSCNLHALSSGPACNRTLPMHVFGSRFPMTFGPACFIRPEPTPYPDHTFRGHEMSVAYEMAQAGCNARRHEYRYPVHRHHPHPGDGRGAEGEFRPSRHADGAWRRSPTRCGKTSCAIDPADPIWPNRDRFVLSVGHASMLLYSLLHLAGVEAVDEHGKPTGDRRSPSTTSSSSASSTARRPGHPEYRLHHRRRDHHRPARPGLRQLASAWRSPSAGSPTRYNRPGFTLFDYAIYALCGDGDMMEGVASEAASHRRPPEAVATSAGSTTATTSPSRATPTSPSARMSARASRPMAGTCCMSTTPTTPRRWPRRSQEFEGATDRPTLIIVHSIIGYGAPHKQDTREAHGEPLGEDEIKAAKTPMAGPRTRSSWCPTACNEHFAAGDRRARRAAARGLEEHVRRAIAPQYPGPGRASSTRCRSASCRTAGTATSRSSRPTRRAWPRATASRRC